MTGWRAVLSASSRSSLALLAAPAGGRRPSGPASGRVLVLSLPGLSWDEVYQGDTPNIDALLDESAVAAMSVRDVLRRTRPPGTATQR